MSVFVRVFLLLRLVGLLVFFYGFNSSRGSRTTARSQLAAANSPRRQLAAKTTSREDNWLQTIAKSCVCIPETIVTYI